MLAMFSTVILVFIGCVQLFTSSLERVCSEICARCRHTSDNGPAVKVWVFLFLVKDKDVLFTLARLKDVYLSVVAFFSFNLTGFY